MDRIAPNQNPSTARVDAFASLNAATAKRQRLLFAAGGALLLAGGSWWILGGGGDGPPADPASSSEISISAGDLVNRNLSQKEWIALSGNRLDAQDQKIKGIEGQGSQLQRLQTQVDTLAQENSAIKTDGQRVIAAYEAENQALRQATAAKPAAPQTEPFRAAGIGPSPVPPGGQSGLDRLDGSPASNLASTPPEVKVMTFGAETKAADTGPGAGTTDQSDASALVVEDSPEYLPPNSYAPATVIVGVDASAGVSSQTDPLPVVLRITGPARSVVNQGRVLTTRIEGCIVNGAARGDLSAEKVYVKLAKMTCDQPGGRVAVSEVKGFLSFGGKTGVRGRVVSREGALVGQALLAGIAGGFGRGFSANAQSVFSGVNLTGGNAKRTQLSTGDILEGGLGSGVAEAADTVSKYLIERAEQYQPVIEMPTGVAVEIVFLDGVHVRSGR